MIYHSDDNLDSDAVKAIEQLEEQNKRYHEALEDIIKSRALSPFGYRDLARKALEESK